MALYECGGGREDIYRSSGTSQPLTRPKIPEKPLKSAFEKNAAALAMICGESSREIREVYQDRPDEVKALFNHAVRARFGIPVGAVAMGLTFGLWIPLLAVVPAIGVAFCCIDLFNIGKAVDKELMDHRLKQRALPKPAHETESGPLKLPDRRKSLDDIRMT